MVDKGRRFGWLCSVEEEDSGFRRKFQLLAVDFTSLVVLYSMKNKFTKFVYMKLDPPFVLFVTLSVKSTN